MTEKEMDRVKLKDSLMIVATSMTIVINIFILLGGLKWFVWLNQTIDGVVKTQERITLRQDAAEKWQHDHEIYTAHKDPNYLAIPPRP